MPMNAIMNLEEEKYYDEKEGEEKKNECKWEDRDDEWRCEDHMR